MSLAMDWLRMRRGEEPVQYLDDVFRYALSRLGNREDAEDVACEVVQALPSPCYRRDLRVYMIGVARRKIADYRRRFREAESLREDDGFRFDHQSDEGAVVNAVLEALTTDHREVLILKYIVGMSSGEIGKLLNRRSSAIDSLLQRARAVFAAEWTRVTSEEVKF